MNSVQVELLDKGTLTDKESEVFCCVCEGLSDKQIAQLLGCSIKTVACHIDHVYVKFAIKQSPINTRCTAVGLAVAHGMVRLSVKALVVVVFMVQFAQFNQPLIWARSKSVRVIFNQVRRDDKSLESV